MRIKKSEEDGGIVYFLNWHVRPDQELVIL